jgi:isopenicillin-N epimerase
MLTKSDFLLDPDIIFLNHGSFGATPREVFDVYQDWQRRLEAHPVKFIARDLFGHFKETRETLGAYLNTDADDLVLVPNATFGVNIVARSLKLEAGDEILMSDHEYGACYNAWLLNTQGTGVKIAEQEIPLPIQSPEDVLEEFWKGVNERTKLIFLSQITSATAICFPVKEICKRARQAGILTLIDGAHAPGQVDLDLTEIGADFYVGNCHKWMLSAKGAGFLHVQKEHQNLLEPLVVSWGWGENSPYTTGSRFLDNLEWWGTKDPAAHLSVGVAIKFLEKNDWHTVRTYSHQLVTEALQKIQQITGLPPIYPSDHQNYYNQMAIASLPLGDNTVGFQEALYAQYKIEIPIIRWKERSFVRVSIQAYNTPEDVDRLAEGIANLLPQFSK